MKTDIFFMAHAAFLHHPAHLIHYAVELGDIFAGGFAGRQDGRIAFQAQAELPSAKPNAANKPLCSIFVMIENL